MEHAREEYEVSERRACRVVRQWRGTQRYLPLRRTDEDQLTQAILDLAVKYGRYGYRRITALLQSAGWPVGKDRVQRIWRREGLKVPQKQRARGRLWLGDGSCVRLRPERANQVWSYDFVKAMTHDGRALRILVVIDEYTRECLALRVARRLGSLQVIDTLADVMLVRGIPEHIRSDNGPEFIAEELRKWLGKVGTRTLYIEPGSPWENGYCDDEQRPLAVRTLESIGRNQRVPGAVGDVAPGGKYIMLLSARDHPLQIDELRPTMFVGGLVVCKGECTVCSDYVYAGDHPIARMDSTGNRDQDNAHSVKIAFDRRSGESSMTFEGPVEISVFGRNQYRWHPAITRPVGHAECPAQPSVVTETAGMRIRMDRSRVRSSPWMRRHRTNCRPLPWS